jgi:hypothetical protein
MFKDPIARRKGKEKETAWDYRCPTYDERSSCYVNAGSHWGLGFRNPTGHKNAPKTRVETLPFGRPPTLEVTEIPTRNLRQEYIE